MRRAPLRLPETSRTSKITPMTSPITPKGQIVYGVILGLLTGIFRLWGASPEGVSYAIILSNLLVPMIERVTLPKAFGKEGKKA